MSLQCSFCAPHVKPEDFTLDVEMLVDEYPETLSLKSDKYYGKRLRVDGDHHLQYVTRATRIKTGPTFPPVGLKLTPQGHAAVNMNNITDSLAAKDAIIQLEEAVVCDDERFISVCTLPLLLGLMRVPDEDLRELTGDELRHSAYM